MGLDIALGLLILLGAVRGWMRGFVVQVIRLTGLVGCVYAAAPVRDLARPYVAQYLTRVRPEQLDRLLWWIAAVLVYVVGTGVATLAVKMVRRRPFGEVEPNRADQFGGFFLGAVKALVYMSFVVAGLDRFAVERLKGIAWADEQITGSFALKWNSDYHPAERIWASPPVQHYVGQIRRMGLQTGEDAATPKPDADPAHGDGVQAAAANPAPRLNIPPLDPDSPDFRRRLGEAVGDLLPRTLEKD